jgi:DNA-binding NarL/FixJ family response regulator
MKLSVYLIEDDLDFAKSLLQLLTASPMFEVVGHASTLAKARSYLRDQSADVFLVDINLPDGNGIDMMREIRAQYAQAKIMVLSTLGHEKHIVMSLQAGASGYLLKSEIPSQIIQSIVSVANDGGALGQHASKVLIDKLTQPAMPATPQALTRTVVTADELKMLQSPSENQRTDIAALTPRELEILKVVQGGSATKQVAALFGISAFTVNQHLRSIYAKLGARNKMEAVQTARQQGML